MKQKLILALAVIVAIASATREVQAWGGAGHSAIAYIAEKHLTPEARQKCQHYLRHSLAYYASWQDQWRFTDPYKEINYWHTSKVDAENNPLPSNGRVANIQIDRIRKEMKNYQEMDDSTIIVNLKLLIHMVGDFHKFWDASPAYLHKGWTCEDFHRNLDKMKRKQIAKIVEGTAEDWARQNGAEMREVYKLIPRDAEYTQLPEQDRQRAVEICEQQMLRGAYRLAHVLNEIFQK